MRRKVTAEAFTKTDGGNRDKAEVDGVKERPVGLGVLAEYGSGHQVDKDDENEEDARALPVESALGADHAAAVVASAALAPRAVHAAHHHALQSLHNRIEQYHCQRHADHHVDDRERFAPRRQRHCVSISDCGQLN